MSKLNDEILDRFSSNQIPLDRTTVIKKMKQRLAYPKFGILEKIGSWFNSDLGIVQIRKLADFFEKNWKTLFDNKSSIVIYTTKTMSVYKKDDYLKSLKDKSELPKELKFESEYHPFWLLCGWASIDSDKK